MPIKIYEFEITLLDIEPRIWRRFAMSGNMGLKKLHSVIQIVMGWEDYHLHSFEVGEKTYDMDDEEWMEYGETPDGTLFESGFRIRSILKEGDHFFYKYDFGDGWRHSIKVLQISAPHEGVRYPVCLDGARACPPEDVGGVDGYQTYLEALTDPRHEDHEQMVNWRGPTFNSNAFDVVAVNQQLRKLR